MHGCLENEASIHQDRNKDIFFGAITFAHIFQNFQRKIAHCECS